MVEMLHIAINGPTLEENLFITTINCDLAIVTCDEKMHKQLILVANHNVLVVSCPKTISKTFGQHS